MKSLDQLKSKLLKNPQTREEYDALAGEFETARELIAASEEHQASPEHADGAALRPDGERGRRGADYEQYITVQEAAERLNRPEPEIWRMLETGALSAILRAELASKDGTPLGFGFALLPPEGVARVVDQGGDDFTLQWVYAHGHAKAVCKSARSGSVRVLWEPSRLPQLMSRTPVDYRGGVGVQTDAVNDGALKSTGVSKRWTPEGLAEMAKYRDEHGSKQAAAHFGISGARLRQLLPRKTKPTSNLFPGPRNRR